VELLAAAAVELAGQLVTDTVLVAIPAGVAVALVTAWAYKTRKLRQKRPRSDPPKA